MRKQKILLSFLIIFAALFVGGTLTSCGGTKYNDGMLCGAAEPGGTNVFSQVRNFYVEQYVFDEYKNDTFLSDNQMTDLYLKKFNYDEDQKIIVEVLDSEDDHSAFLQAHYLFAFYGSDESEADKRAAVDAYLATLSLDPTKIDGYKARLDVYANDGGDGSYFPKLYNDKLDGESVQGTTSVQSALQSHSKACLVFEDGFHDPQTGVLIEKTSWKEAFNYKFFTGLLSYPMGWLLNVFVNWFGATSGIGQVAAIFIVTALLKIVIFFVTFSSQTATQKMNDIQPELLKIQAKYGQTPTPEQKQQMSIETMAIYKKYGIKPLAPFVSLLITFPVFIAIYRAISYLAVLRTGYLGTIILGNTISSYIIGANGFHWEALVIFIIMAASQVLTMKLPQWLNNKKLTQAAKQQQAQTNMMSNAMMIMILVMGFSMPVLMDVYWIASALISTLQSLLLHKINTKNGGKLKPKKDDTIYDIPQGRSTN